MPIRVIPYSDPVAFLAKVQPFLERQEVVNSLILGIIMRMAERPDWIDAPPYLAVAEDEACEICLVAEITPSQKMLLAAEREVPQVVFDQLCENLRAGGWALPGVTAVKPLVAPFVAAWEAATGRSAQIKMNMRLYELRQVIFPPHPPAGFLRLATMKESELVTAWREAFSYESLHETPPPNFREVVERQIKAGTIFLWDNQGPVSMAASSRPTTHGISINSVYTPPEWRGQGYASACVAALSQQLLDSGKQFCALFTDLNYPTSNSIYQKMGYRPVCDFSEYILPGS